MDVEYDTIAEDNLFDFRRHLPVTLAGGLNTEPYNKIKKNKKN